MTAAGDDDAVVSKGEFARLSNVSPGRVSQWIEQGKVSGDALVGEGRAARVRVRTAQAQLKRHLDPTQMTANGVRTRIPSGPLATPPRAPPASPAPTAPSRPPRPADGFDQAEGPEPGSDPGSAVKLDLTEERARLAKEQADRVAIQNAKLRGELLDAAEIEHRWADEMVRLRSRMLAVPVDLPQLLPGLTKHELGVIDRAIRDAMSEAADDENAA